MKLVEVLKIQEPGRYLAEATLRRVEMAMRALGYISPSDELTEAVVSGDCLYYGLSSDPFEPLSLLHLAVFSVEEAKQ